MKNILKDDLELKNWVLSVVEKVPGFLDKLKDNHQSGRFHYSLSGDIKIPFRWGLGNAVFATKCYYILNRMDLMNIKDTAQYIKSFQKQNSYIYDPMVQTISWPYRIINSVRNRDFNNCLGKQTKRAETRQSFAALRALEETPYRPFTRIPYTKNQLSNYIHSLNWEMPWGAASHFSHYICFLSMNKIFFKYNTNLCNELIDHAFNELEIYRREDGAWYKKGVNIENYQKVNGGMKVMTAYGNCPEKSFSCPEKLIDICFATLNTGDACNHFNIICLLYNCAQQTDYKREQIIFYMKKRLHLYKEHWWENAGGFSFLPRKANSFYYGAYISKGLPEPDIHGTHLFLWGLALICNTLQWEEFKLRQPIT